MQKMNQEKKINLLNKFDFIRYWNNSIKEIKSTKALALAGLFIALKIAMSAIYFTVPGPTETRIYFSFIITSLGSMIYGPFLGLWAGFVSDTVGFLVYPTGSYFFGYCITSMVTGLLYGLFLYQQKITVLRLFICKASVNIICNIGLNGLWASMLSGGHLFTIMLSRTPKNLMMLPIEVTLLYITFSVMIPILNKVSLLPPESYQKQISLY